MTDASGAVVGEQRYYPYGETRLTTGSMFTDKLFTGQREMAGLGIYHYGALTGGDHEPLPGEVTVSFFIPDDLQGVDFAILFWNGSEWVELEGKVSEDGLYFEVTTNFVGTFVLVTK